MNRKTFLKTALAAIPPLFIFGRAKANEPKADLEYFEKAYDEFGARAYRDGDGDEDYAIYDFGEGDLAEKSIFVLRENSVWPYIPWMKDIHGYIDGRKCSFSVVRSDIPHSNPGRLPKVILKVKYI